MSALMYLVAKSIKNGILDTIRRPAKLAVWLVVILGITAVVIVSMFNNTTTSEAAPIYIFSGILFVFIAMFLVISLLNSLSGGDAIFGMYDVNLLFVSPVNPRKILLYGIVRMTQTAILASFFILFQSNSLKFFGISFTGVLVTFFGFLFCMVVMLTASLVIYSVVNSNPFRKRLVRIAAIALFVPALVFLLLQYLNLGDINLSLAACIDSLYFKLIPVAGWTTAGITAAVMGDALTAALFFGLDGILLVALVVFIVLSNPDYYEDALVATESAFEKKRALESGDINVAQPGMTKKVRKLKNTGLFGSGASAIFGKHMRENFRASRFGIVTLPTVILVVIAVLLCYFTRDIVLVMQIMMWIQIMMIGTGRGLYELYSHYIFMIPVSSFKKIVFNSMEIMAQVLVVSVAVFTAAGLLVSANIFVTLLCGLAFFTFSFMILGINYLQLRLTGASVSQGALIMIYFILVILIAIVGVVPAMLIGFALGGTIGLIVGLLILNTWQLIAGLICFALSAGVLQNCDMQTIKMSK